MVNSMGKTASELMEEWIKVFKNKEHDYGSSWKKTGKILKIILDNKLSTTDEKDYNALSLLVRILDKLCRFSNLYFDKNKKPKVEEKLAETLSDCGVYCFMLASLVSESEPQKEIKLDDDRNKPKYVEVFD